jgi:hypothetical protein
MKLKQIILSTLAIVGMAVSAHAQDVEGGIMLGATAYQGDLTQKQLTLGQTKPALGLLARYYFGPRIDVKANFTYGWIEGTDKDYKDLKDRYRRDLSFKSHVAELGINGELNILPFISNSKRYRFAPYVFAGVAVFHFNPHAINPVTGSDVDLQPLGTEGQGSGNGYPAKYSLWQVSIPYGFGIKYSLGQFWNIGLEVGQRKLFTDYLDDVSSKYPKDWAAFAAKNGTTALQMSDPGAYQVEDPKNPKHLNYQGRGRGNTAKDDMYVFAGITLTKTLRRFSCTNF